MTGGQQITDQYYLIRSVLNMYLWGLMCTRSRWGMRSKLATRCRILDSTNPIHSKCSGKGKVCEGKTGN